MPIIIDTLLPKYETGPQVIVVSIYKLWNWLNASPRELVPSQFNYSLLFLFAHKEKRSMAEKSKILIIGGTGNIGKFLVEASAKAGRPTFLR